MRSTRGRSLYVVNPLEQIYEMKCRDNDIKVIPEIMEMFLKSQKEDEKLNLEFQNIKNLNAVGNALHGIIQLNLAKNQIQGLQQFAKRVNKSQLIHLDLSSNVQIHLLEYICRRILRQPSVQYFDIPKSIKYKIQQEICRVIGQENENFVIFMDQKYINQ
ncbi:hypothetical protein pb186bvf_003402 [Paramecium bursaria]